MTPPWELVRRQSETIERANSRVQVADALPAQRVAARQHMRDLLPFTSVPLEAHPTAHRVVVLWTVRHHVKR
jgi:hypothetical protein